MPWLQCIRDLRSQHVVCTPKPKSFSFLFVVYRLSLPLHWGSRMLVRVISTAKCKFRFENTKCLLAIRLLFAFLQTCCGYLPYKVTQTTTAFISRTFCTDFTHLVWCRTDWPAGQPENFVFRMDVNGMPVFILSVKIDTNTRICLPWICMYSSKPTYSLYSRVEIEKIKVV